MNLSVLNYCKCISKKDYTLSHVYAISKSTCLIAYCDVISTNYIRNSQTCLKLKGTSI